MTLTPQRVLELQQQADVVCSAAQARDAVARVAGEITRALAASDPLVLCVMRGALVFAGQLLPQLDFPLQVDTIDATRYGNATRGAQIEFRLMPAADVRGREVLLLDDILDQGVTLAAIRDRLLVLGAGRVWIAVFAVKDTVRQAQVTVDFAGIRVPDRYVFGFGMDVHGYWRNLAAVYALKEELTENKA